MNRKEIENLVEILPSNPELAVTMGESIGLDVKKAVMEAVFSDLTTKILIDRWDESEGFLEWHFDRQLREQQRMFLQDYFDLDKYKAIKNYFTETSRVNKYNKVLKRKIVDLLLGETYDILNLPNVLIINSRYAVALGKAFNIDLYSCWDNIVKNLEKGNDYYTEEFLNIIKKCSKVYSIYGDTNQLEYSLHYFCSVVRDYLMTSKEDIVKELFKREIQKIQHEELNSNT